MASSATLRRGTPKRLEKEVESSGSRPKARKRVPSTGHAGETDAPPRRKRASPNGSAPAGGSRGSRKASGRGGSGATGLGKAAHAIKDAATPDDGADAVKPGKVAGVAAKEAFKMVSSGASGAPTGMVGGLASSAAKKTGKFMLHRAIAAGRSALHVVGDRAAEAGREVLEKSASRRLPIQVSVDIAVPIAVAWEQWMQLDSLTEGVHLVKDIERDGDNLTGTIAGPRGGEWEAEILDQRPEESFAWRSFEGSDCAGLVTFHELSKRLTRVEVNLDVVPINPPQTVSFALHLAHRHAEAELRRLKAHLEFINPDVYEQDSDADADADGESDADQDSDSDQ
jgi:uncharacterized membrane protein